MFLRHICEVCGKEEILTSEQGYEQGWDYPPSMGGFGVVSPRTCGGCTIENTLWWALAMDKKKEHELTEKQVETLQRIMQEPDSIIVSK